MRKKRFYNGDEFPLHYSYKRREQLAMARRVKGSIGQKIIGHGGRVHDNENENYSYSSTRGEDCNNEWIEHTYAPCCSPIVANPTRRCANEMHECRIQSACATGKAGQEFAVPSVDAEAGKRFLLAQELLDAVCGYSGAEQISLHLVAFEHTQ